MMKINLHDTEVLSKLFDTVFNNLKIFSYKYECKKFCAFFTICHITKNGSKVKNTGVFVNLVKYSDEYYRKNKKKINRGFVSVVGHNLDTSNYGPVISRYILILNHDGELFDEILNNHDKYTRLSSSKQKFKKLNKNTINHYCMDLMILTANKPWLKLEANLTMRVSVTLKKRLFSNTLKRESKVTIKPDPNWRDSGNSTLKDIRETNIKIDYYHHLYRMISMIKRDYKYRVTMNLDKLSKMVD